ncbi:TPA: AAA family ATPase [Pseudomonas putida]
MILNLVKPYKSITRLKRIELPDLTIITGTNGAGKSQLLRALDERAILVDGIEYDSKHRPIRLFDATTLVPADTGAFPSFQSKQEKEQAWNEISKLIEKYKPGFYATLNEWPELTRLELPKIVKLSKSDLVSFGVAAAEAEEIMQHVRHQIGEYSRLIEDDFLMRTGHDPRFMKKFKNSCPTPIFAIDIDLFYAHQPNSWHTVDIFQQSFARLFSEYRSLYQANELRSYRKERRGIDVTVLSDEEFIKKHGPQPWDFVNEILETAKLTFRINKPDEDDDRPYEPILTDLITHSEVKFNDLSSGERILMSFALCLYYTRDQGDQVDYPDILLFDEIDAPLHPSMTKSLLDTIINILIKERGIKVIMTTHSPSTIALSPEESIFTMEKEGDVRLKKTSKDSAISVLMSGVPSISISYENRRQVFVESHLDVEYYDQVHKKIKHLLHPAISLSFIASGKTKKGGCAYVKDIVEQLCSHGNQAIKGLIDWDTKNTPSANIVVAGYNERYSIENYILDPILVAMLLFQDKSIQRKELGMNEEEGAADILKMDQPRLQIIADYIIKELEGDSPITNSDKIMCSYLGGQTVLIPKSFLTMQGHDLEGLIKKRFIGLQRYHNDHALKREILKRIVDEYPDLIPTSLFQALKDLQHPIPI